MRVLAARTVRGKLFMCHFSLLHLLQSFVCRPCNLVSVTGLSQHFHGSRKANVISCLQVAVFVQQMACN